MKSTLNARLHGIAALLTTVTLAACTAPGATAGHAAHHPGGGATMGTQPGVPMPGGQAGAAMSRMCAMHRSMQNAPPGQHQATMDQQMKDMSPEMRQQHMEMMRQHCK